MERRDDLRLRFRASKLVWEESLCVLLNSSCCDEKYIYIYFACGGQEGQERAAHRNRAAGCADTSARRTFGAFSSPDCSSSVNCTCFVRAIKAIHSKAPTAGWVLRLCRALSVLVASSLWLLPCVAFKSDAFSNSATAAFLHNKIFLLFLDVKASDGNEAYAEVSALWRM